MYFVGQHKIRLLSSLSSELARFNWAGRSAIFFFEKNQVQFKNNSRIFQVNFWSAIFKYTTKYYDRQAHLKLILLPLAYSKIASTLRTYPVTFLKQLVKSGI